MPLNFTKSINLALSERGITAIRHAGHPKLLDSILETTIPMRGRMIHGRGSDGKLYEDAQDYDIHGKVGRGEACRIRHPYANSACRPSSLLIERA